MSIRMTDYIDNIDELSRGESVAVCHSDCPAGEDTRYRLYLTKPAGTPNIALGYCHNCDESGVLRNTDDTLYRDFYKARPVTTKQIKFEVPANMVEEVNRWPTAAKQWRIQKGLDPDQCEDYGIKYDPTTHRIYLPIYRHMDGAINTDLIGYQLRVLDGKGPKYLTAQIEQDTVLYSIIRPVPQMTDTYVLVEDLASGIAIADAVHGDCKENTVNLGVVVNYGVKTKIEAMNDCPNFKMGYVWLDNDGAHIVEQAENIAKTWRLVQGRTVKQNFLNSDPKQYNSGTILEILGKEGLWTIST